VVEQKHVAQRAASAERRRRMRRKSPRVVWLPVDLNNRVGKAPAVATAFDDSSHFFAALTGPALGVSPDTTAIPLVKDGESDQALLDQTTTIADIASSGYRLRRIVGKIVVIIGQGVATAPEDPTLYQVTAGIMVCRTDIQGTTLPSPIPSYSPESIGNNSDPWIWRRSWVLCDVEGATTITSNTRAPRSNIEGYGGGNADASHVDQKTARIVGAEERLFFFATCRGLDGNAQAPNPGLALIVGDLRVLGTVRTNIGNRGNSTR